MRSPSSTVGRVDLAAQGLALIQNRRIKQTLETNQSKIEDGMAELTSAVTSHLEFSKLSKALTLTALVEIHAEIEVLQESIWDLNKTQTQILKLLEHRMSKEEIQANLRLLMVDVEAALEEIQSIEEDYPVYAAYKAELLSEILTSNEVDYKKFKFMERPEDIKWAKSVIDDVHSKHRALQEALD